QLLGPENFRKGMNLYFARHDGEAATVEQFVQCLADVSGADLTQFMLWYSQAGTPEVVATGGYHPRPQTYRPHPAPHVPATPRPARRAAPPARASGAGPGGSSRARWAWGGAGAAPCRSSLTRGAKSSTACSL